MDAAEAVEIAHVAGEQRQGAAPQQACEDGADPDIAKSHLGIRNEIEDEPDDEDEEHQDQTVRVDAILKMNKSLGTPDALKEAVAIPTAGGHVLGSSVVSKDIPAVEVAIDKIAKEKLNLVPVHGL